MKAKGARDLPLYRACYRLLCEIDDIQNTMSRDRKHTIGNRMMTTVLDMINSLRFAWDFPAERVHHLLCFMGKYDQLAALLKMSEEKGYILQKRYVSLLPTLANIEKQGMGWLAKPGCAKPESEESSAPPSEQPFRGGHTLATPEEKS